MKAGTVAFNAASLAGSALASDYWPAAASSSSTTSTSSSAAWDPAWAKASSSSTASESCTEEWGKGSWGSSGAAYSSSSSVAWGKGSWGSSSTTAAAKPTWASVPAYFDPQWACCKTVVTETVYGSATAKPAVPSTTTVWSTASPITPAPYPVVTVAPSGTYSWDATTITLTNTITVIAKKTAALTSGDNWFGGVTTSVSAPTTVTCPYAAKSTSGTVVTDVINYTTFVCPSAGVYTPVPQYWTSAEDTTTVVYEYVTEYAPGTWVRPATTVTVTVEEEVIAYEWVIASATPTAATTSTWAAPVAPVAPTSTWAALAPAYTSSAAAVPSKAPTGGITSNGNKWAMTYTPYSSNGQCKSASDVDSDIAQIASFGFSTVRIYATDCSGITNVGNACVKHGLKIILGVFIESSGISGASSQVSDISSWGSAGNWGSVALIVVGNEAIFNGYVSASDLAGFIGSSKSAWQSAGYWGPVTTTEPVNIIQQYAGTLCGAVDVAAANIQPFFTSSVVASSAGTFVAGQLALVEAACGKTAYNLESGWPSSGWANGLASPSKDDQKAAISDIIDKAGDKTAIFSFENDAWKDAGSFGVEQFFGCSDLF